MFLNAQFTILLTTQAEQQEKILLEAKYHTVSPAFEQIFQNAPY